MMLNSRQRICHRCIAHGLLMKKGEPPRFQFWPNQSLIVKHYLLKYLKYEKEKRRPKLSVTLKELRIKYHVQQLMEYLIRNEAHKKSEPCGEKGLDVR